MNINPSHSEWQYFGGMKMFKEISRYLFSDQLLSINELLINLTNSEVNCFIAAFDNELSQISYVSL